MSIREMLKSHPTGRADQALLEAVEALGVCAQTCTSCADACLGEEHVANLRRCITLDLDCADVCIATASVLIRQTQADNPLRRRILEACIEACERCAEECERHADMHEHCRICAEACRMCAEKCRAVLQAVPA